MRVVKDSHGITLIELIFVVILLVILGATVATQLTSLDTMRLAGAARRLASDIGFAQQMSTAKQNRHGVVFTATSYTVFENDNPADPARNPLGGGNYIVDFTTGEFHGITITTILPGSIVKFNSSGVPLDGSNSPLTSANNTITLALGSSTKTVTVTPNTGKVVD